MWLTNNAQIIYLELMKYLINNQIMIVIAFQMALFHLDQFELIVPDFY